MLERKMREDQEKAKLLASTKEQYKAEKNKLLRYNETLKLNRKGHSQAFKAVTRMKRDAMLDGTGTQKDKVPPLGHYRPQFEALEK